MRNLTPRQHQQGGGCTTSSSVCLPGAGSESSDSKGISKGRGKEEAEDKKLGETAVAIDHVEEEAVISGNPSKIQPQIHKKRVAAGSQLSLCERLHRECGFTTNDHKPVRFFPSRGVDRSQEGLCGMCDA